MLRIRSSICTFSKTIPLNVRNSTPSIAKATLQSRKPIINRDFSSSSLRMTSTSAPIFTTSRLQGKVVVITGASGGIGRSAAILFARTGANVVLSARRKDALEEVENACKEAYKAQGEQIAGTKGGKFASIVTDMRDRKSIDGLIENLPEWAQGKTDILISNAGLVRGREHVGDINPDEIDEVFETNVRGFIHVNQLFVKGKYAVKSSPNETDVNNNSLAQNSKSVMQVTLSQLVQLQVEKPILEDLYTVLANSQLLLSLHHC